MGAESPTHKEEMEGEGRNKELTPLVGIWGLDADAAMSPGKCCWLLSQCIPSALTSFCIYNKPCLTYPNNGLFGLITPSKPRLPKMFLLLHAMHVLSPYLTCFSITFDPPDCTRTHVHTHTHSPSFLLSFASSFSTWIEDVGFPCGWCQVLARSGCDLSLCALSMPTAPHHLCVYHCSWNSSSALSSGR